jgi:serine-type D-Ala-D-Ala endopeptidase (penicillin-binding protein 7)
MIGKIVAQILMAFTVLRVVPVDAANLEWQLGIPTAPDALAAPLLSLTTRAVNLPMAGERILPPKKTDVSSYGVVTDAQSVFVADMASGAALFAKNADDVRPVGSITKLMTALVFLDSAPDLASWVTIISDDYVGGGRVYLNFDDNIRLRDVLGASMVGSDNTATKALSRLSGLSADEFIAAMNVKAKALSMTSSSFTEVTGIDSGNMSTAHDLMLLLTEAKKHDVLVKYMTTQQLPIAQASGFSVTVESTDMLFGSILDSGDYAITGGKTGYIPEAGYCFITTVKRNGDEIFVAVLGAHSKEDRFTDTKALAMWAFSTFTWPNL